MRRVPTALGAGLGITGAAALVVLSQSPVAVLASNATPLRAELAAAGAHARACQAGERLPRGTVAIRLSLAAFTGPQVSVEVTSGARVLSSGERGSGWDGQVVTVPIKAARDEVFPVSICFAIPSAGGEGVKLLGSLTGAGASVHSSTGKALGGRLRIEYLGHGPSSWLRLLPSVARHIGFGRAWSGLWVAFLLPALMLVAAIAASRLILRELDE